VGRVTRAYRREWLVVPLVWLAALSFIHEVGPQDITRLASMEAIVLHGSLRIDRWQGQTPDKAEYGGHYYSDKAPGMSFLAVPSFVVLRAAGVLRESNVPLGIWKDRGDLWLLRTLTSGLGFLAVIVLVGRVAEALEPGTGAITATTVGLGTLVQPLAATFFAHVVVAALGFGAFVLAWSGLLSATHRDLRFALGGLCAGLAVFTEYQTVFIAFAVLVYLAARTVHGALVFLAAALPAAVALAVYNTAAFDSPLHLSYRYVSAEFASEQAKGFFGIGFPDAERMWRILFTWDGLLLRSPILVLAAAGLVLLWRKRLHAEAVLCGSVTLVFLLANAGYYDIVGGGSPGPRFFVPAIPFLAVGLACSFGRWPRLTLAVAVLSACLMTWRTATWFWPDFDKFLTLWTLVLGVPTAAGVAVVVVLSIGALALGALNLFEGGSGSTSRRGGAAGTVALPADDV
jgi:hypothetical protein